MANYRIDVYDTSGNRQAVLTDFINLAYARTVNTPGIISITLSGNHSILTSIEDKWVFEVWRKTDKTGWSREIVGLFRNLKWEYADNPTATIQCYDILSMLGWRIVAYKANTTNRSKFISKKAETIANTLVKYNATASGTTADGRIRLGTISGMSVEADGASGNTLDWFCAYDNLLETLQDLAIVGGGDFDVVKTGANAYQFRWYENQLGTDKSSNLIFAMNYGNMANPTYSIERSHAVSVAIVGGQGEEADREVYAYTSSDYNLTLNNIETFHSATNVDTTSGLKTRGYQELAKKAPKAKFGFSVLQTPGCQYGEDYVLGDLVSVINPFTSDKYTMKIVTIQISLSEDGSEKINIGMGME